MKLDIGAFDCCVEALDGGLHGCGAVVGLCADSGGATATYEVVIESAVAAGAEEEEPATAFRAVECAA